MEISIRVQRVTDHVCVAYKVIQPWPGLRNPCIIEGLIRVDAKLEARRLSKVYGPRFFVRVWCDYDTFDGHCAFTYFDGTMVQSRGF